MATVRITNYIREHVENKFNELFKSRLAAKLEELQHLDLGTQCYEHYTPEKYRRLVEELNTDPNGDWVGKSQTTAIVVHYIPKGQKDEIQYRFTVRYTPPKAVPLRQNHNYGSWVLKPGMPGYDHTVKILHEYDEIKAERDSLIQNLVHGVMVDRTTLAGVLELWPGAMEFMPDGVAQEHARKVEPKKRVKTEVNISPEIKASLLKAKLMKS